jgi:hypothetical protein
MPVLDLIIYGRIIHGGCHERDEEEVKRRQAVEEEQSNDATTTCGRESRSQKMIYYDGYHAPVECTQWSFVYPDAPGNAHVQPFLLVKT